MNNLNSILKKQNIVTCPYCKEKINEINYSCNITTYGKEYGEIDLKDGQRTTNDGDIDDSETDNYKYECPKCNEDLSGLVSELEL